VQDLLEHLQKKFPALNEAPANLLSHCAVAVNEVYIQKSNFEKCKLRDRDEVAIIPPVSGG